MKARATTALLTLLLALASAALVSVAQGAASSVQMTQACFAGSIEGRFRWQGNDVQAREQWLDLTTFDNKWEPGTYQSDGPFTGRTTTHTWLDLQPDTVYYFRVTQQLSNGTWEASGTFTATTTTCPNSGGIKLATEQAGRLRETMGSLVAALGPTVAAPGRLVGFSTTPVSNPGDLTPPGGTISGGCQNGVLYAVLHVPTAVNPGFGTFGSPGDWSVNGQASIWNRFRLVIGLGGGGLGFVRDGGVIRVSTFTFDTDFKSVPGQYEVRYGTGVNAIEGRVTLSC
jgi:hypothetical protein